MKNIIAFFILIALISCNKEKVPDHVIPKQDMVNILVDIHVMDGIMSVNKIRKQLIKKDSVNYYKTILNKYSYTRKDFDTSLYYYSLNLDKYDKIYEEVLNRLNKMETELKELD